MVLFHGVYVAPQDKIVLCGIRLESIGTSTYSFAHYNCSLKEVTVNHSEQISYLSVQHQLLAFIPLPAGAYSLTFPMILNLLAFIALALHHLKVTELHKGRSLIETSSVHAGRLLGGLSH
jgi:hypothetical protein